MLGLFSFASESHIACGSVHKASNEHTLRSSFARRILRDLIKELISPYNVAAATLHTVNNYIFHCFTLYTHSVYINYSMNALPLNFTVIIIDS